MSHQRGFIQYDSGAFFFRVCSAHFSAVHPFLRRDSRAKLAPTKAQALPSRSCFLHCAVRLKFKGPFLDAVFIARSFLFPLLAVRKAECFCRCKARLFFGQSHGNSVSSTVTSFDFDVVAVAAQRSPQSRRAWEIGHRLTTAFCAQYLG